MDAETLLRNPKAGMKPLNEAHDFSGLVGKTVSGSVSLFSGEQGHYRHPVSGPIVGAHLGKGVGDFVHLMVHDTATNKLHMLTHNQVTMAPPAPVTTPSAAPSAPTKKEPTAAPEKTLA